MQIAARIPYHAASLSSARTTAADDKSKSTESIFFHKREAQQLLPVVATFSINSLGFNPRLRADKKIPSHTHTCAHIIRAEFRGVHTSACFFQLCPNWRRKLIRRAALRKLFFLPAKTKIIPRSLLSACLLCGAQKRVEKAVRSKRNPRRFSALENCVENMYVLYYVRVHPDRRGIHTHVWVMAHASKMRIIFSHNSELCMLKWKLPCRIWKKSRGI